MLKGNATIIRMKSLVFLRAVFLALCYILSTSDMWSGLENRLFAYWYIDDATHFVPLPSLLMRPTAAESLNSNLAKISAWWKL